MIVVDNHNHVLYFWYEARKNGIVENGATLVHIDEHSDLWNNAFQLSSEESKDLEKVFRFTNFQCNVGNYILPAKDEGLIGEIWRVEGENDLIKYQDSDPKKNSILNLDLDFFSPELEYIDYKMKKDTILRIATRVRLITIATSPFFIDQKRALEVLHDLFD